MKSYRIILPIVLCTLFVLTGCNKKEVDVKQEEEKLLQADREFAAYSKENGAAAAFREFLAEDALQFSAQRDVIVGNMNVYEIMKEGDEGYDLLWEPQFAQSAESGDLGWTWGYYDLHIKESGDMRYGKYVNVWRKDKNGNWKVAADIGNPGPDKENRMKK